MAKSNKVEQVAVESTEVQDAPETKTYDVAHLMSINDNQKSKVIRYLKSEGLSTSEITKTMKTVFPNFLYQHARNVLNQKTKKDS